MDGWFPLMNELMIHATATDTPALLPPRPVGVDVPPAPAQGRSRPVCVQNRALPGAARAVATPLTGGVNWRRVLVAVTTLAALGSVAYWTFGKPIFGLGSSTAADRPSDAEARRVVDWTAVDRALRKAFG